MKVLLVGAGAVGEVMTHLLAKEPEVTDIICGSRNLEKLKRISKRIKSKKVSIQRIDANKLDDILAVAKGVDVVANTTPHCEQATSNLLNAAFQNRAFYHDLCLPFATTSTDEPLPMYRWDILEEQSSKWRGAGLTGITNGGICPGVVEVFAKNAADRLDRVHEIRERAYYDTTSKEPSLVWWDWGERIISLSQPMVYKDGKFKRCPFGGEEEYPFPAPAGPLKVYSGPHPEVESFPRFVGKGLRYVDAKYGPWPEMWRQMGFLNDKPINVGGVKVAPLDVLTVLAPTSPSMDEYESKIKAGIITDSFWNQLIEVKGEEAGMAVKHISYVHITLDQAIENVPGSTVITYGTASPAVTFIKMLAAGEIKTKGLLTCDQLSMEERKTFLSKLAAERGIVAHEIIERHYK